MKTPLIIAIIIMVVLVFLAWFFTSRQNPNLAGTSTNPTATPQISPTAGENPLAQGGSSYLDPNNNYSFLYPNDWRLDTGDSKHIRIFKTGATQQGQTEMYDGVIMVFETIDLSGKTLEKWTDDYINSLTKDGTMQITEAKKPTTIGVYPAYTFKARGLGESQYIIAQKDVKSPIAVLITYMVADPENVGFQAQVDQVLSSLQILK